MTTDISMIFPAFNEEHRIAPTIATFDSFLSTSGYTYEMLVVDDGSTDGTGVLVNELIKSTPSLTLISSGTNRGKGHAVRLGMIHAKGHIRVMSDADGSTAAEELIKLLDPILKGEVSVAIGSRYLDPTVVLQRQPILRRMWSRVVNRIVQQLLLPGISDTHCGFKAFTAESAKFIFSRSEIDGWSCDLETLALARLGGFHIREIPVLWKNDARSHVKLSHLSRSIQEFLQIVRRIKTLSKIKDNIILKK